MSYSGIRIGDMYFNAIVSSTHEFSNTLAGHTMENGVTITDHVNLNPRRFSIQVDICNTEGDVWPVRAFQAFETAWRNREPFTIVTHHGIYDNMIIETGTFVENDIERGRLSGDITCQQLMFAAVQAGQGDVIDVNALPGTRAGIAAAPQKDSGIQLEDSSATYDLTIPEILETSVTGELELQIEAAFIPMAGPESLSLPEERLTVPTPEAPKPSKFPIKYENGNISFSSPVAQDTFNRFRTYTSYGMDAAHVLLDVLDVNGNPIKSGLNMVPGGDNLLRGYTDDLKINVLDITPRLPIGERIGTDSVQICVGGAKTAWPRIMRYD